VSWTASGSGTPTIGHGLGAVPSMIIMKPKSLGSSNWSVYHAALGNATTIRLNNSSAAFSSYFWNSTTPSSTVFTIGTDYDTNQSGATMIAYCFAEKKDLASLVLTQVMVLLMVRLCTQDLNQLLLCQKEQIVLKIGI
jgi:hypothetical protein